VVLSDLKKRNPSTSELTAQTLTLNNYYPFGMLMPNRHVNTPGYRFGFNGMEMDDEVDGEGNSYTAEFWQYDSRLGRRWNRDPKPNPSISEYATFAGNPIIYSDAKGDTAIYVFFDPYSADQNFGPASSKETYHQERKEAFLINLQKEFNAQGIDVLVLETSKTFDEIKNDLKITDQYLELVENTTQREKEGREGEIPSIYLTNFTTRGATSGQHSTVNIYRNESSDRYYYDDRRLALSYRVVASIATHEIYHGFLHRSAKFFSKDLSNMGFDDTKHYNSTPNIMKSGDLRTIPSGNYNINFVNDWDCQTENDIKILQSEQLLRVHFKLIQSWQTENK